MMTMYLGPPILVYRIPRYQPKCHRYCIVQYRSLRYRPF